MLARLMTFLVSLSVASAADAITVTFTNPVELADGRSYYYNDPIYKMTTLRFTDIATDQGTTVDMRVTTTIKTDTLFADDYRVRTNRRWRDDDLGYIPRYETGSTGEPNDDLGFQYIGQNSNANEKGITMTFDFFDGTGALSGTFTNALVVSQLDWAIYDVDGEASQTEFFRAFKSDGLYSFRLGNTPQALTATDSGGNAIRFDGVGTNYSESDPSGAAILTYLNTSSFTLDFGSVQSDPDDNFVFSGIDGDLSMFDLADFTDPFMIPTTVPLPAGLALMLSSLGALALVRRRRT